MSDLVSLICRNPLQREGLARILSASDFEVLSSAADVRDVDWAQTDGNALAVIDTDLTTDAVGAVQSILAQNPTLKCVLLVDMLDMRVMLDAFRAGAHAYLVKDMDYVPLVTTLKLAAQGQKIVPPNIIDALEGQALSFSDPAGAEKALDSANLSQRETDVLCCLMAGHSNKVIARSLDVSEATVKVHVKAILRKLKVGNRTQAAIWATNKSVGTQSPMGAQLLAM